MTNSTQQSSLTPNQYLGLPVILVILDTIFSMNFWSKNFYIPFLILIFFAAFFVGIMIREVPLSIMERKRLILKQTAITFVLFLFTGMIHEVINGTQGYDVLINAGIYSIIISAIQWLGGLIGRGVNLPEHRLPSEIYLDPGAKPKKKKKKKKKKKNNSSQNKDNKDSVHT